MAGAFNNWGLGGFPSPNTVTQTSVQTSASGAVYIPFADLACTALDIINNSSVEIEYKRGASTVSTPIPAGSSRLVVGIGNANEISLRRSDVSNTQITIKAEAFN